MAGIGQANCAIRAATVLALAIALGAIDARAGQEEKDRGAEGRAELWLFLAPEGPGLATEREIKRLAGVLEKQPGISLRPAVLVTDWKAIAEPSSALAESMKALRSALGAELAIAIWDLEALAFAQAVGVERLPAYVLLVPKKKRRHAHVVYGAGADLEELFRCAKR